MCKQKLILFACILLLLTACGPGQPFGPTLTPTPTTTPRPTRTPVPRTATPAFTPTPAGIPGIDFPIKVCAMGFCFTLTIYSATERMQYSPLNMPSVFKPQDGSKLIIVWAEVKWTQDASMGCWAWATNVKIRDEKKKIYSCQSAELQMCVPVICGVDLASKRFELLVPGVPEIAPDWYVMPLDKILIPLEE